MKIMKKLNFLVLGIFFALSLFAEVKMIPASFKDVAEKVKPSVVNISTVQVLKQNMDPFYDEFFNDDFFERFFGIPKGSFKRTSLGTGFIVDKNGYIMTNNHVVEKADEITVKLYNQKEYKAKIIGVDKETDVAVIKINENNLTPINLGDSDKIDVGDWVIAIGSPFGLEQSVTQGIISAKGRVIGAGPYDNFLQTDAAINPGNSGGPLVNLNGEVIGINTAITSRSGGYEGVGFAIPINMAKKIYEDIVTKGKVIRGWLGVGIQELTPELAKHFKVKEGVLISQVFKGSPAEKGGIKRGDVVLEFDGKKVSNYRELQNLVAQTPVNKIVKVKIVRNGQEKLLDVKTGERNIEKVYEPAEVESTKENDLGIVVGNITPDNNSQYGTTSESGVVVLNVLPGSPADDNGIMRGDIIHEVNGVEIKNVEDFNKIASRIKKNSEVVFLIERSNAMLYIAFKVK